jgi:hypothetical protein
MCLTTSRRYFLPGTINKCIVSLSGVSGRIKCKIMGTVSWTIKEDQGQSHNILIPNTPMCTELPHRIMSPQHGAQEIERKSRLPVFDGWQPKCKTNVDLTKLSWGRGKFTKTVVLDKQKKVAVMTTKPGIKRY